MHQIAAIIAEAILEWLTPGTPMVIGICGTQASGKSTACEQLEAHFSNKGLKAATLSLDDLYLSKAERERLAETAHLLFITRGPPGTHDCALGIKTLDAIKAGQPIALPRFDKRQDQQILMADWPLFEGALDVLFFEGWCVGVRPQDHAALLDPVNHLEAKEDADCRWRKQVNTHLAGETCDMFSRLDKLIYLRPPSFEVVHSWRCEQERAYQANETGPKAAAAMDDKQIRRFIAHYERLTRHIMHEMPDWADLTLQLDEKRGVDAVLIHGSNPY